MKRPKHLIIAIFLCFLSCLCKAQTSDRTDAPQRLFEEGRILFNQKAYTAAAVPLQKFLAEASRAGHGSEIQGQRMEAEYMLTCIAYETQETNRTNRLQTYLGNYPDSPHANRLTALLASTYFYDEDYESALDLFNQADLSLLEKEECYDMTYQLAVTYLKKGDLENAAVWFRTLRQVSPKHADDCTYYLAYIDYNQQAYESALQGFRQVENSPKYQALAPYYMAEIYLLQQDFAQATETARSYLANHPNDIYAPEMNRIIGNAYYTQGDYQEAMKQLETYLNSEATEAPRRDAVYMLGVSYFKNGVYSQVPPTLGRITTEDDALSQNAYLYSGLAYLQLQDKNLARMAFQQAASSDADMRLKEQAAYNYALAIHETSYSAFGESVNAFEQFLNNFPNSSYADQISDYLIDVYTNTRSYDAALKSIERIKTPNNRILLAKARILFQLGTQDFINTDFDNAVTYFTQSISTAERIGSAANAYKADAFYWRGESNYRKGLMDQAAKDYHSFLSIAPNRNDETFALAYYNLGYIYFHKKDYSQAQKDFQQFVNSEKEHNQGLLADAYNRIGDCYLNRRLFSEAKQYYSRSEELGAGTGDYSLYQLALVAGLEKNYQQKVSLLNSLESKYPTSPYVVNALYEKGRSYVEAENTAQAIGVYQQLVSRFPESPLSRRASAEIGLLYYQNDEYDNAIKAYKEVLTRYPGSEESRLALRDLRSLYVDTNRVDEYTQLAAQMPDVISFQPEEQDSLSYVAAERIYMRGELATAKNSLSRYLQTYPEGAYRLNAHYYLSQIARQENDETAQLAHLNALLEYSENNYSEEALLARAQICYNQGKYAEALSDYKRLQNKASTSANRQTALYGTVQCAAALNDDIETINAANTLLTETKLSPEAETRARYLRAKAYLNQHANDLAYADLQTLAKDTRTMEGAEAKYLAAQLQFNEGKYAEAEKEILDFIDQSTPHAYWLARGFILLSDIYVKTGKKLEAREYLLSLQQNYQADDDIAAMIDSRMQELK